MLPRAALAQPGLGDASTSLRLAHSSPGPGTRPPPRPPAAQSSASPHLPSFGGRTPPLSPPCWAPLGDRCGSHSAVAWNTLRPPAPAHTAGIAASRQRPRTPGRAWRLRVGGGGCRAPGRRWRDPTGASVGSRACRERVGGPGLRGLMASRGPVSRIIFSQRNSSACGFLKGITKPAPCAPLMRRRLSPSFPFPQAPGPERARWVAQGRPNPASLFAASS